jgi:tetratricopeptide (TPR) repeat protein
MKPPLLFAVLLAAAMPAAHAADPCSDACHALVREGHALQAQGQYPQAYAKFKAASDASPRASIPASSAAALMVAMSASAKPEQADKLRAGARDMASQALRMAPDDPAAQEVLRMLDDATPSPLHMLAPDLARIHAEGEALFAQQRYPEALARYEAVMRADPAYSIAWVNAGDCWYMQKDAARAAALFRRATEIEPRNAQAWRFLADALASQGQRAAAESALMAGIGADPAQRPTWRKLGEARGAAAPLAPLSLRRGSRVTRGADGKFQVNIDDWALKDPQTPDAAIRLTLAITEASVRQAAADKTPDAYDVELEAWRTALKVADELKTNSGKDLTDPALLTMQMLAREGQLEAAILLLLYRESYRAALERWRAAHPDGVKTFIARYKLQP